MSNTRSSRVISSDSKVAYKRWNAPGVKSINDHKTEQAGLLTARQLEDLQKQAYDEGLQSGKDDGYAEGLEKGKEEGLKQGFKEGKEAVAQVVKRFEQMLLLLADPLQQVNQQVEEELLELALATARQIIRREITLNPEQIVAVVKEAIGVLPSAAKKIKVYLNPDDAEIIRQNLNIPLPESTDSDSANNQSIATDEAWSIVEDATLNRGGCHIKTENSQVDATIGTRLAKISVQIFGDERSVNLNELDEDVIQESDEETSHEVEDTETDETPQADKDDIEEVVDEVQAKVGGATDKADDTEKDEAISIEAKAAAKENNYSNISENHGD